MVMQKIIEVCICTIDYTPCSLNRLCIKCKKYKELEINNNSKEYTYILNNRRW